MCRIHDEAASVRMCPVPVTGSEVEAYSSWLRLLRDEPRPKSTLIGTLFKWLRVK